MFETLEPTVDPSVFVIEALTSQTVELRQLLSMRSWRIPQLRKLLRSAERDGLLVPINDQAIRLTERGAETARRIVRNHRLWELYLIEYADIAPSHVDRDADDIEHLLGSDVVSGLESLLEKRYPSMTVPPSPHAIGITK